MLGVTIGALVGPSRADDLSVDLATADSADSTVTDKAYFDIGLCPGAVRTDRNLGDKSVLCSEAVPVGRLVIGLYGRQVPTTVANFKKMVDSGAYVGTIFHRILPGQYIQAGRQGSHRFGDVEVPTGLEYNPEIASGKSFVLGHVRPGAVSLCLSENDDDPMFRDSRGYHNAEFLITTGPGPAPQLDGQNLVFGQVVEGFDTLVAVSEVPVFNPNDNVKALNALAGAVGDERARKARKSWGRPLKAVVITGAGIL